MRLQPYSAKPRPRFIGDDKFHLGVELEVVARNHDSYHKGLDHCKRPGMMYAKKDGSLGELGWEIVTHPIAPGEWLRDADAKGSKVKPFWGLLDKLRELDYKSHDGSLCGMHVHVSRSAFGGTRLALLDGGETWAIRTTHYYWFAKLINSPVFAKLSQREPGKLSQWARQMQVTVRSFHRPTGHYSACNLTQQTVEVRVFRGNLREDRVRKNLEAVIAAVEFSKTMSSRHWRKPLEGLFAKYVSDNKALYPNLFAFMIELGITQKKSKQPATCEL